MNIYFVRHGESELNATRIHQNATTPLSALGQQQAVAVAERLSHLPIDQLISSHYTRAQSTALAISKKTNLPVTTCELFHEVDRPSALHGLHYQDPFAQKTLDIIRKNHTDKNYRHSDEETFYQAVARAEQAMEYIRQLRFEDVVIVSHGTFLRLLVSRMMFGDMFNHALFEKMSGFQISNAGITHCTYLDGEFRLVSWNDRSHFA